MMLINCQPWTDATLIQLFQECLQMLQSQNRAPATKIPVLGHADGVCSIYADKDLDNYVEQAKRIVVDAKTNYPQPDVMLQRMLMNKSMKNWDALLKAFDH